MCSFTNLTPDSKFSSNAVHELQRDYGLMDDDFILAKAREIMSERVKPGSAFDSPSKVKSFLTTKLGGFDHEVFAAIYLDNSQKLIEYSEMFHGTINQAIVYPREIARMALRLNASVVIISHNHPSGSLEFSAADERLTKEIKVALALFDIRLIDHILIDAGSAASMAESGMI